MATIYKLSEHPDRICGEILRTLVGRISAEVEGGRGGEKEGEWAEGEKEGEKEGEGEEGEKEGEGEGQHGAGEGERETEDESEKMQRFEFSRGADVTMTFKANLSLSLFSGVDSLILSRLIFLVGHVAQWQVTLSLSQIRTPF